MRCSIFSFVLGAALLLGTAVQAETIVLTPSQDNTLYDDTTTLQGGGGAVSNGAGPHIYVGLASSARRGLIAFDLSGIPAGSTITSVSLTMGMNRTHPLLLTADVSLHRTLSAWGEGTSNAGGDPSDGTVGGGGAGIAATTGDATWLHTFFDTTFWTTEGGDFAAVPSAVTSVTDVGSYTWEDPGMVADVQSWLNDPASNFGWVVLGDEVNAPSVKRFWSREAADAANAPQMVVGFEGPAVAIPTLSTVGLAALVLLLMVSAWFVMRRRSQA